MIVFNFILYINHNKKKKKIICDINKKINYEKFNYIECNGYIIINFI